MPSYTEKQRRFAGADLARKRAGKRTKTAMSEKQLSEFAGSVRSKMPKGGTFSPAGDLGLLREEESRKVGGYKEGRACSGSMYF